MILFPLASLCAVGRRAGINSCVSNHGLREGVDAGRVPAKALPLTEGEDGNSVRTLTIAAIDADRFEPRGYASCSKGTLNHVVKVSVTWETARAVAAGEPMMAERVNPLAAVTQMALTKLCTQPKGHRNLAGGVI